MTNTGEKELPLYVITFENKLGFGTLAGHIFEALELGVRGFYKDWFVTKDKFNGNLEIRSMSTRHLYLALILWEFDYTFIHTGKELKKKRLLCFVVIKKDIKRVLCEQNKRELYYLDK